MSNLQVDNIFNKEGTTSSNTGVKPPLNDDTTLIPSTAWVQDELDDRSASSAEISAAASATQFISPARLLDVLAWLSTQGLSSLVAQIAASTELGVASRGRFNGSIPSPTLIIEEGNTHTVTKNETGSYTIILTEAMANTNYQVIVTLPENTYTAEVTNITTTQFTIVTERDDTNFDCPDLRFTIIGRKA